MRQNSTALAIAKTELFAGLTPDETLALLADAPPPRAYRRGEILYSPTAYLRSLAFILSGTAMVYKVTGDKRVLMNCLGPGSIFGMAALFVEEDAYPTEIHAAAPCKVLFLSKTWLEAAFEAEPHLSRNYITLLSERIRFLNQRIETFTEEDARSRLLRVLSGLHRASPGPVLTLPYSLSQLAQMLDIGRASLYRALDSLRSEGVLLYERRNITLLMPEKFE